LSEIFALIISQQSSEIGKTTLYCRSSPLQKQLHTPETLMWLISSSYITRPTTSLGHQQGRRVFRGAQIFWTMSNIFKLCPTHFSRRGKKNSRGTRPPGYGPVYNHNE